MDNMDRFKKYYRKSWQDRLDTLWEGGYLTEEEIYQLKDLGTQQALGDEMIENYITNYALPEGLGVNYWINGKDYVVPMVTEEPSVIAASCNGARIIKKAGGFKAQAQPRLMIGQVIIENVQDEVALIGALSNIKEDLLKIADVAHPSLKKRGGGARWIRFRLLADDLMSVDLAVDVQEAMGANMLNTMLEAVAAEIRKQLGQDILLSILSNYATDCLATAECSIPVEFLAKKEMPGAEAARRIAQASRIAQLDPYRAATHNKGIMNGIDAVVLASGNDWRAIEAGAHAYAARDGKYRGLSQWKLEGDKLKGQISLPLPVGFVGGSIGILPQVKLNHKLLRVKNARELEEVIASVGLAQNLAALWALVTVGIQQGHMKLQLRSLAVAVGARQDEVAQLVDRMRAAGKTDSASAKKILQAIRKDKK